MNDAKKIVFFGTSHFAVPILNKLADSPFKPSLVVTQPDAIVGRKKILMFPPVKVAANAASIEVIQPETLKTEGVKSLLMNYDPDLFILAAYGKIIPKAVLKIPRLGNLNIHPSLLPLFRGSSPIHAAILSGASETAATIIQMDEEIDHGPIVSQEKIKLSGTETYDGLQKILSEYSANLLLKILPDYCAGNIKPAAQDHSKASFTKLIRSEDARIDWSKSADEIDRQIRAYHLWPKAHTAWKESPDTRALRINILKAGKAKSPQTHKPGTVRPFGSAFAIAAGNDLIVPEILQLEGRKESDAGSFLRGHQNFIGTILI
ncbi:methionyl-tRNA formyltransferase [Patescibacteria group bacterium]|nr:MAG: methionyl-tRNA formyltransferase [Patescibacteria group bacterium]